MTYSINMLAPAATPNMSFTARSGNAYTSDASGVIKTVIGQDIIDLSGDNCISLGQAGFKSTFSNTVAPGVSNDNTQDFGVGSHWLNTTTGIEYVCVSAATGAAVWQSLGTTPTGNPWQVGNFYGIPLGVTPVSLLTITATLYAYPILIPNTVTVKSLNLSVITGQTGGAAHIGLYADNGNGYPGALIQDSGALAATATAVVTKGSLTTAIPAGLYWGASIFTASSTMPSVAGSTVAYTNELTHQLGSDTAAHLLATSAETSNGLSVAGTYGALPATFTAAATLIQNAGVPLIAIGV